MPTIKITRRPPHVPEGSMETHDKGQPHSYQIPPCVLNRSPGTRQRQRRRNLRRRGGR